MQITEIHTGHKSRGSWVIVGGMGARTNRITTTTIQDKTGTIAGGDREFVVLFSRDTTTFLEFNHRSRF